MASNRVDTGSRLPVATENSVRGVDGSLVAASRDLAELGAPAGLADFPDLAAVLAGPRDINVPVDGVQGRRLSAHDRDGHVETERLGSNLATITVGIGTLLFGSDGLGPNLDPLGKADTFSDLVIEDDRHDDRMSPADRIKTDGQPAG